MMKHSLDELCLAIVDCEHKTAPIDQQGEYFAVGTPAMKGNRIDYSQSRRISRRTFEEWTTRLAPQHGDILFAREAPVGPVVLLPEAGNVAPGQRTVLLRPNSLLADAKFLHYKLTSGPVQQVITALSAGSTVPHLNVSDLKSLKLEMPTLRDQRAISEVLSALDDKIAANASLVSTADQIMETRLVAAPVAESRPLSALAHFVNGKAFTKEATGTGRVIIRIAELNSGLTGSTVYSDAEVGLDHTAGPGDILFAWSGSLTLNRWFRDAAIINQHIFKVIPVEGVSPWLIYGLVRKKLTRFREIAADKATTMGHIQRRHLDDHVDLPPSDWIRENDVLMAGLWAAALTAERESLTLAATRDALLPQLMSGALRVRDAARIVSEVA